MSLSFARRASFSLCRTLIGSRTCASNAATCSEPAQNAETPIEYTDVTVPANVLRKFPDQIDRERLNALALEFETVRYVSVYCPNTLKTQDWMDLFQMDTAYERIRYYGYLRQKQREKEKDQAQKLARRKERAALTDSDSDGDVQPFNRILQRTEKAKIAFSNGARVASHIMAGVAPRVVLDMGFLHMMGVSQRNLLWNQLRVLISENKSHSWPTDLHFANFDEQRPNELSQRFFDRFFTHSTYSLEPTFHAEDLLQLFHRSDLLYLSPDAPNMLRHVDLDRVYVIGGLLKQPSAPVTLAKAKELNLECAKLPLDIYVKWQRGHKSLTLNSTLRILQDYLASNGDWHSAIANNVNVRKVTAGDKPVATMRGKQRRLYYREMMALVPPVPKRGDPGRAHEPRITGWKHGRPVFRVDGHYGIDM